MSVPSQNVLRSFVFQFNVSKCSQAEARLQMWTPLDRSATGYKIWAARLVSNFAGEKGGRECRTRFQLSSQSIRCKKAKALLFMKTERLCVNLSNKRKEGLLIFCISTDEFKVNMKGRGYSTFLNGSAAHRGTVEPRGNRQKHKRNGKEEKFTQRN